MDAVEYLLEGIVSHAAQSLDETLTGDRPDVLGQGEADRFQTALGLLDADVDGSAPIGAGERHDDAHLALGRWPLQIF
jgi:hypothetical protein